MPIKRAEKPIQIDLGTIRGARRVILFTKIGQTILMHCTAYKLFYLVFLLQGTSALTLVWAGWFLALAAGLIVAGLATLWETFIHGGR